MLHIAIVQGNDVCFGEGIGEGGGHDATELGKQWDASRASVDFFE